MRTQQSYSFVSSKMPSKPKKELLGLTTKKISDIQENVMYLQISSEKIFVKILFCFKCNQSLVPRSLAEWRLEMFFFISIIKEKVETVKSIFWKGTFQNFKRFYPFFETSWSPFEMTAALFIFIRTKWPCQKIMEQWMLSLIWLNC